MLRKLLKHEMRATARTMLPFFGVILGLSLCMTLMLRLNIFETNIFFSILFGIISVGYGASLFAVFIVALVLMINRFRTNLLGDEGYIMFTLPVSVHKLLWSKILTASFWFFVTVITVILSVCIVAFDVRLMQEFFFGLRHFWAELNTYITLNGVALIIESLVVIFLGYVAGCLQFYSAMAIGHSFSRSKILYSIIAFFVMQFALNILGGLLISFDWLPWLNNFTLPNTMMAVHSVFGLSIVATLIYCAVFYFITTHFLQKKRNID